MGDNLGISFQGLLLLGEGTEGQKAKGWRQFKCSTLLLADPLQGDGPMIDETTALRENSTISLILGIPIL